MSGYREDREVTRLSRAYLAWWNGEPAPDDAPVALSQADAASEIDRIVQDNHDLKSLGGQKR